jgi:hypothetical protein
MPSATCPACGQHFVCGMVEALNVLVLHCLTRWRYRHHRLTAPAATTITPDANCFCQACLHLDSNMPQSTKLHNSSESDLMDHHGQPCPPLNLSFDAPSRTQ